VVLWFSRVHDGLSLHFIARNVAEGAILEETAYCQGDTALVDAVYSFSKSVCRCVASIGRCSRELTPRTEVINEYKGMIVHCLMSIIDSNLLSNDGLGYLFTDIEGSRAKGSGSCRSQRKL
jgi:hypothetical protein